MPERPVIRGAQRGAVDMEARATPIGTLAEGAVPGEIIPDGLSPRLVAPTADVDPAAVIGPGTRIWHLAQVRENAVIGRDCIIGRGVYIGSGVRMGDRCKIQNQALVYEPANLADGVFIGPAVVLTNDRTPRAINPDGSLKAAHDWHPVGVTIGTGAAIGARAVCVAPVLIGPWASVAAGAVVTHDVPAFGLVMGVPARRVGWVGRAGVRLELAQDADSGAEWSRARDHSARDIGAPARPTAGTPLLWRCPMTGARYRQTGPEMLEELDS